MWRDDHGLSSSDSSLNTVGSEMLTSSHGVFPRPWSLALDESGDATFAEVINKFFILGKVVAKALQDGRVLDFHFSKAFYKLIIGQVCIVHKRENSITLQLEFFSNKFSTFILPLQGSQSV